MFRKLIEKRVAIHGLTRPYGDGPVKEIPSPKGLPLIGTTLSLIAAGSAPKLHVYIDGRHRELGHIFRESIGPVSAVFVSNPDVMRAVFSNEGKYPVHVLPEPWIVYNNLHGCTRGLFFMDGEEWLENRRKMNKLLLRGDMQWLEDSCQIATDNLIRTITKISANNEYIPNLEALLYRWSLDVMVAVLVGDKSFRINQYIVGDDLKKLADIVHLIFQNTSKLSVFPASLAHKLRLKRWRNFEKSVDDALRTAKDLVNKILQLHLFGDGLLSKMLNENIEKDVIMRIVTDLILAAGDTTAYSMEWMLYLVSRHINIQEELRREIRMNPNTPLLRNILKESLRLYPVAPFLTRFLPEDVVIDGYAVPKNTLVILSIYTSGRDKKYFENPNRFNPDRWLRDQSGNFREMLQATMPFAIGARSCIGRKIAEIQLQNALRDVVKKFAVTFQNEKDIEMVLKMVAVPSEPVQLKFTKL